MDSLFKTLNKLKPMTWMSNGGSSDFCENHTHIKSYDDQITAKR